MEKLGSVKEAINAKTIKDSPEKTSRRNFIAKTAIAALGSMIPAKSIGENIENTLSEIEKCRKIIENERYEEIISSPSLVSAFYYSEEAVKKMGPPRQNGAEKIIWNIYPLITREFRENYINALKKIFEEKESEKMTLGPRFLPLDTISFGKNLNKNHLDAIDLFTKEGSPVCSMSGGIVVLAENGWMQNGNLSTSSERGGNTVIIFDPNDESFYRYAHMQETKVAPGMIVAPGDTIGIIGHTGINASKQGHGEHLHLEINRYDRDNGVMVSTSAFELKRKLEILKND